MWRSIRNPVLVDSLLLSKIATRGPSLLQIDAAIIATATNLGIIAMSNSTDELSVDILRDVVRTCIREETIKASNAEIMNAHTKLLVSNYYGLVQ